MNVNNRVRALLAVALLVVFSGAYASADTITCPTPSCNTLANTGTGFGAVFNLLGLQAQGQNTNEQGANVWDGSANAAYAYNGLFPAVPSAGTNDVKAGVANGGSVVALTDIVAAGGTSAANLGLVFQVNQESGGADPIQPLGITLYVFDSAGNVVYGANCGLPNNPCNFAFTGTGVGTSGWLLLINGTDLNAFLSNPSGFYLGIGASLGFSPNVANDGPENFYLVVSSSAIPEPSSLAMLFGSGALGLAGVLRRKLRK